MQQYEAKATIVFWYRFLPELRNGACLLGTIPDIVRHFSACILCFGAELDGFIYFSCSASLCRYAERKAERESRFLDLTGIFPCYVYVFAQEAAILRTSSWERRWEYWDIMR
ncbi:MAG: hypothetical protein L6V93_00415 [Clostridiales bacterium]|nr:MAG: hypothetical protein L6V93_00415 [Clostridiales bacterium]